jgi:two-component system response regulator GlrR
MFPRRSSILLLDDDAAMRRLMTLLLKRAGYRVHAVEKGNEAIAAIDRSRYDAILLDIMMPTEGGMTVINHLRKKDPALLKRVLIVTGTPPAVLKSITGEVAGIVNKPFEAKDLLDAIERAAKA